jgi:hypothetical protein
MGTEPKKNMATSSVSEGTKKKRTKHLAEVPKCHPTGEQNFIKSLIHFDKDNISDKVLKKIGAYCAQPDFQPDIIGRVSLAAKSLCMWVRAMEVGGSRGIWGQ